MSAIKGTKRKKATMTMIAVPTIIVAGETSNLSGQVKVNGRPKAGIVVVFATENTFGVVIPAFTITDAKGNFTAKFRSFINPDQPGFRAVIVTAALPSFPGVSASSVIAILRGPGSRNRVNRRKTVQRNSAKVRSVGKTKLSLRK